MRYLGNKPSSAVVAGVLLTLLFIAVTADARRPRRRRPPRRGGGSTTSAKFTHVVTLGDSFSSGVGIHVRPRKYDDHGPAAHWWGRRLGAKTCYREDDTSTGAKLARSLGAKYEMRACRGAVAEDEEGEAHIANQLRGLSLPAEGKGVLFVLTIGGNDLRTGWPASKHAPSWRKKGDWPELLQKCIQKISKGCHKFSESRITNFPGLTSRLQKVYGSVASKYPKATIRILHYPRMMQPKRGCVAAGVTKAEAKWVDKQVDRLNGIITRAAVAANKKHARADIKAVSVTSQFDGHGVCQVPRKRFINGIVPGPRMTRKKKGNRIVDDQYRLAIGSFSSFHPKQKGYDAYLSALRSSL